MVRIIPWQARVTTQAAGAATRTRDPLAVQPVMVRGSVSAQPQAVGHFDCHCQPKADRPRRAHAGRGSCHGAVTQNFK